MRRAPGYAFACALAAGAAFACVGCADGRPASERAAAATSASAPKIEPFAAASTNVAIDASAEPDAVTAPPPVATADVPYLATTRLISWVYEKPNRESLHAGYFRAGARVVRSREPVVATDGAPLGPCEGKWWKVEPTGFACEGHDGATTNVDDETIVAAAAHPPDVGNPFPYGYGTSYGSPLYTRVPTREEQARIEGDIEQKQRELAASYAKMDPAKVPPRTALPIEEMPGFLADHRLAPRIVEWPIGEQAITAGYAWANMRLSFTRAFEFDGRAFYLTTEHFIVPADRMRAARLADFKGVLIAKEGEAGEHFPMMWVRWKPAKVYERKGDDVVETEIVLPFQTRAPIASKDVTLHGTRYCELSITPPGGASGATYLVRSEVVTRVDPTRPEDAPHDLAPGERWIEVRISQQVLILYEGTTPIFTTLVSTGVDGAGDVETTRSTPRGYFRIHSKHYSYRMSADEHPPWKEGDKPDPKYRIDDVGYVQYFTGGYALHAAYWHDAFGQPKSHGCINLSPRDALYLFGETLPKVPPGWHGVYGGRGDAPVGTILVVRL